MGAFKEAHGGTLRELYLATEDAEAEKRKAVDHVSWDLTERQLCDVELLLNGAFSPLEGFLGREDYDGVVQDMRLVNGVLWPVPITLDVTEAFAAKVAGGDTMALRDSEGVLIATLEVSDIWTPDRTAEARSVFGTEDSAHPGVNFVLNRSNPVYVGGRLRGVEAPTHYDFKHLRDSPREIRDRFAKLGWRKVVAFQTRNPMHRAHQELTFRAAREVEANLLIHPVVGMTKPGDIDHYTRVRCYENILKAYPEQTTSLSLLPLAMRMAGPREAVWHAIIRKNHGCTHFVVGRDHAGPGKDSSGKPFYGPYDAQELLRKHEQEIEMTMVPFRNMVYAQNLDTYFPEDEVPAGASVINLSGTEQRRLLQTGAEIPSWFTFPAVVRELRATHPPRSQQGVTVFFTGLSGSGKSTIANALLVKLLELGGRAVTLLDGDLVRKHLSSELGFSKEHRDINIRRIGYVASEITKNGGIAICAPIAPYDSIRKEVRNMIEPLGGFALVHVATPLEECEKRDRKGLYAKARAGILQQFTGISDPYEVPTDAALTIQTIDSTPDSAADTIIGYLRAEGYLASDSQE